MSKEENINTIERLEDILKSEIAVLLYFNTNSCNVGEALEPKIKNLLKTHFSKMSFHSIDINFSQEISAKYSVFIEPTVLVFFEGKETIRKSRNIGIFELEDAIKRPYQLIFE